jgi:hypothetical protein
MCPKRHFIFDNPLRGEGGFFYRVGHFDRAKNRAEREESVESEERDGEKERGEREEREHGAREEMDTGVTRELINHTA